ncbi:MAG: type VI secretion system baseplate subunit TssF [Rhizobiaceae bacterium]|nr:type VI secretion system baseplate subunit TssF [Rhizobiaceae bacterium]
MNREFLDHYERELKTLYERSKEFAEEFPGVASRLGGLVEDRMDPAVAGLLEGAAFLAARVQLKLKGEFETFTTELLDMLLPGLLAPVPSFALLRALPDRNDPALAEGIHLKAGDYVDTVFHERGKSGGCRYRLVNDLWIWPYSIEEAEFYSSTAPLQARGIEPGPQIAGALRIRLSLPSADAASGAYAMAVNAARPDHLTFHVVEPMSDGAKLHELLLSRLKRIVIRHEDKTGAIRHSTLPPGALEPVGFEPDTSLFGHDDRVFSGFQRLREYFAFPAKFLGFRLCGLKPVLKHVEASSFELFFEFDESNKRLTSVIKPQSFALYAVPVANLFEATCTPVQIRPQDHEHAVIVERSRPLDHEIVRILDVSAQLTRSKERIAVHPLYSVPPGVMPVERAHYYSSRRLRRRWTEVERRTGLVSTYLGTETFISLKEPKLADEADRVRALNVRALVTNRHLTDKMPLSRGQADFVAVANTAVGLECIAGPTPPRETQFDRTRSTDPREPSGAMFWKLLNILQFNHLGLSGRSGADGAAALRELLLVFADASNPDIERRIRGIVGVESEPVVRKVRQPHGFSAARGLRVTIEIDESAFEGTGAFQLGLVLSRFLGQYAAINSFIETALRSRQRSLFAVFAPEIGRRETL